MVDRYEVTLRMEPPSRLALMWYRRLGMTPPLRESRSPLATELARLVPYQRRDFHRRFANAMGYFWIACPLCDCPFGGHEGGMAIPNPMGGEGSGLTICSECTGQRTAAGIEESW